MIRQVCCRMLVVSGNGRERIRTPAARPSAHAAVAPAGTATGWLRTSFPAFAPSRWSFQAMHHANSCLFLTFLCPPSLLSRSSFFSFIRLATPLHQHQHHHHHHHRHGFSNHRKEVLFADLGDLIDRLLDVTPRWPETQHRMISKPTATNNALFYLSTESKILSFPLHIAIIPNTL